MQLSCSEDDLRDRALRNGLIETARSNGLEPYRYLCYLFDKLPVAQGEEQLKALLSMNLTVDIQDIHQKEYQERGKSATNGI